MISPSNTVLDGFVATARAWLAAQLGQSGRTPMVLAVLGVVMLIWAVSALMDVASTRVKSLGASQQELVRLKQEIASRYWDDRKQESFTLRFQLSERLWTAETAGLAEASLERWLRERLEGKGIRVDSIRVQRTALGQGADSTAPSVLDGVQRMTAKVIMPLELEALFELLGAVANSEKFMVIDRLIIRTGRNALVEMDVSTFVNLANSQS